MTAAASSSLLIGPLEPLKPNNNNKQPQQYGADAKKQTKRELYREKQVVAEERAARIDNSPAGRLFSDLSLRVRGAIGREE